MAITSNIGGVLKRLETVQANVGGVVKNFHTVFANVSGALKKIFSYADNPWVFRISHTASTPSGGGTNFSDYYSAIVGMDISCTKTVSNGRGSHTASGAFSPKTNCKMIVGYTVSQATTLHSMSISINGTVKCSADQHNYSNTISITPNDKVTFTLNAALSSNLSYTSDATLRIRLTS